MSLDKKILSEIERYIRTVKERMRGIYNTLPFTRLPRRMIIEMAKNVVFWLNSFPNKDGISNVISPRGIITGNSLDYNLHCTYQFGDYVQTHEQHDKKNA